jgi:hypothetical protein
MQPYSYPNGRSYCDELIFMLCLCVGAGNCPMQMLRDFILDPETFRFVNILSSVVGMLAALWIVAQLARQ